MHTADMGTLDYIRTLAAKLDAAPHGERGRLVGEAAGTLSLSTAEVYRRLKAAGWTSGRKPRADRGATALSDAELMTVANIMRESTRANGKRLLSCEAALEIATANALVRDLGITPNHVMRLLRDRGLHPDQVNEPAPHVQLATPHPNYLWEIDASVCVLYYLDRKGLAVMSEREFYKNKPRNFAKIERDRVIRYVATDHYSGAFYVEYFRGAQDTENLFNFVLNAIAKRDHAQDPFHGVPFHVYDDAGSANASHLFDNYLQRLQVKHLTHTPGNPRAKGQVEATQNLIERGFEGRLAFGRRVESLEELNALAWQWMRWMNGTRAHTRHGHTRYALWQTIREEQLRIAPDRQLSRELLRTKPEWATVTRKLTVRYSVRGFGPKEYAVAHVPGVRVGAKLEVCVNPYAAPEINVITHDPDGAERLYSIEPIARNAAGFDVCAPVVGETFARQPDTATDTARKAMLKQAYGVETLNEAEAAKKARKPAFASIKPGGMDPFAHLEAQTVASYLARKGTELPIERARTEAPPMTTAAAAKRLRERGVAMNPQRYQRIAAEYPNGVREQDLEHLAALFGAARGHVTGEAGRLRDARLGAASGDGSLTDGTDGGAAADTGQFPRIARVK